MKPLVLALGTAALGHRHVREPQDLLGLMPSRQGERHVAAGDEGEQLAPPLLAQVPLVPAVRAGGELSRGDRVSLPAGQVLQLKADALVLLFLVAVAAVVEGAVAPVADAHGVVRDDVLPPCAGRCAANQASVPCSAGWCDQARWYSSPKVSKTSAAFIFAPSFRPNPPDVKCGEALCTDSGWLLDEN